MFVVAYSAAGGADGWGAGFKLDGVAFRGLLVGFPHELQKVGKVSVFMGCREKGWMLTPSAARCLTQQHYRGLDLNHLACYFRD